ncbi:polysaccharide biosynthesis/export family protein [Aestuariivita sp.]|jgi:polysaccharide export outer membrane protein|uniref:polysaccharide biosynthesis/export family protein n=1 Tax=Aestuariivita sp. TaxID=1872407 RepID=UPI00216C80C5|nr:polysaccharide biosynthesis/export family protein [Aestuariivita sp.]MCE8005555.1 polysaccharide export protein [Aestuariivita sp.]
MIVFLRAVGLTCAFLGLVACNNLPRGAAVDNEILREADDADADFAVYPVTRAFLPSLSDWPVVGEQELSWMQYSQGASSKLIRPGDMLSLRIWDSGENSLLTSLEQRSVDMSEIRVSSSGSIFVPYVGKVVVSGRTSDNARAQIQSELEAIVPSAQVQLSVAAGRSNSVDLVGGVNTPGSYPMPDRNFTVLGLIAAGGGVSQQLANPQIRLVRSGQMFGTSIDRLFANPGLDSRLVGGDKVIVEEDRRYFLSIGATGTEALHPFTKDTISAMDALSITGGINDGRGDPQGILILREYPASAVLPGQRGPRMQRVVFTVDLTNSDGLFSARKFQIRPGDLVLATESPITNARTILGLVGSAFGVVSAVSNN